jgi:hypothetical protein
VFKMCAAEKCRRVFFDRSKPAARRWCMSTLVPQPDEDPNLSRAPSQRWLRGGPKAGTELASARRLIPFLDAVEIPKQVP